MSFPIFEFKITDTTYQVTTVIQQFCNSINFQNMGTTNVMINQNLVVPGDFYNVSGNVGEVNNQQYIIAFAANVPGNLVLVTTKTYTNVHDLSYIIKNQ